MHWTPIFVAVARVNSDWHNTFDNVQKLEVIHVMAFISAERRVVKLY